MSRLLTEAAESDDSIDACVRPIQRKYNLGFEDSRKVSQPGAHAHRQGIVFASHLYSIYFVGGVPRWN